MEDSLEHCGSIRPFQGSALLATYPILGILLAATGCFGQERDLLPPPSELKKMSLEELMDIEVSLVSRQPEKLTEAASAIQVITHDDIRRSGATTLAEALRLASNLQVAQINSKDWAISARGLNNNLSNKLLVMVDGRTIYTPLYAGVFWDVQNVVLDNVDRIEVISGPGGTLWGANAVNGVINVVTRDAAETQGVLVAGGGGTYVRDFGAVRYGGEAGPDIHYRIFGQRIDHDETLLQDGNGADNPWAFTRGGVRMDWQTRASDKLTVHGELYGAQYDQRSPQPAMEANGQSLQARWNRRFSDQSDLQAKAYLDRTWRDIPGTFQEDLKILDFDFYHRFPLGAANSLIWGGGYRLMLDDIGNSRALAFLPAEKQTNLFSGFVQDQWTFLDQRVRIAAGTKLEHNDYSGLELMPSIRAALSPTGRHTLWGAVSRAVRSPSRIDVEAYAPAPPVSDTILHLGGGPDFTSEKLIAYELGYRMQPVERLSLSLAAFLNRYDELRILERHQPDTNVYLITNGMEGDVRGIEFSGNCQALSWWRLRGGITYLEEDMHVMPGHVAIAQSSSQGNDPGYQFSFQSFMNLPRSFELNAAARYVDVLPSPGVPSYLAVDIGVAWQYKTVEMSVYGCNLGVESHPEFGALSANPRSYRHEMPRSFTGRVAWHI